MFKLVIGAVLLGEFESLAVVLSRKRAEFGRNSFKYPSASVCLSTGYSSDIADLLGFFPTTQRRGKTEQPGAFSNGYFYLKLLDQALWRFSLCSPKCCQTDWRPNVSEIEAVGGALNSIKLAGDMAKAMIDIRDGAKLQAKTIELQRVILDAYSSAVETQQGQTALLKRISELEKQIASIKEWDAEKARYELVRFNDGALAFRLKKEAAGTEPIHCICTNCHADGKKSVMQGFTQEYFGHELECPSCKLKITLKQASDIDWPSIPVA